MITLEEKNIEEIKAYLAELPLKYALPLVQYFEKLIEEQNKDAQIRKKRSIQYPLSYQEKDGHNLKKDHQAEWPSGYQNVGGQRANQCTNNRLQHARN